MKPKLIILILACALLGACQSSYVHPPVTPATDASIAKLMEPIR